jgi:hypothetical protein
MTLPYMGSVVPRHGTDQLLLGMKGEGVDGPAVTHVLEQEM